MKQEAKITKKMQFDVIRSVRKQLQEIQTAVRAEDRQSAHDLATALSINVLNLHTEALEAQLTGQQ